MIGYAIRAALVIGAIGLVVPAGGRAQSSPPPQLVPGVHVRIMTTDGLVLFPAWMEHGTSDTLQLRAHCHGCPETLSLPWQAVARIDKPTRHPSWKSALVGAGAGLLVGTVAGGISAAQSTCKPGEDFCGVADAVAVPILGGMGMIAGTGVGLLVGSRRWQQIWPPRSAHADSAPGILVPRAAAVDSTTLILLGTGMPRPDPNASGPATAIVVGSRVFLFDAGPGVMRRVAAAHLPINGPTALFFTHLHSDHTLGYPDVIFTTWVMGRRTPLEAYGPHGLQAMTSHILEAWSEDEDIRTNGLEHEPPNGYAVHVHEISPGVVYDSGGVRITAIPVLHGSWKEAYGYRIDTPTRSIVLSGDTRYAESVEQASRGVDILVHEVYPGAAAAPEARPGGSDWPEYMREFHTSAVELGKLAAAAQPKTLILIHIVGPAARDEEIVKTIQAAGYKGTVVIGKDLERF